MLDRRAEPLLRAAARLPFELQDAAKLPAREIRLGFVDSSASTAGPGLILAPSSEATRVVVWSGLAPTLAASLQSREMNLIVTPDAQDDVEGLMRWTPWKEPFVLLVPKSAGARAHALTLE